MDMKSRKIQPESTRDIWDDQVDNDINEVKNTIEAALRNTTMHGFRYIVDRRLKSFTRIVWIVICAIAVACSITATYFLCNKYATSYLKTLVEDANYPLYNFPFPAVTVCNVNKIQKSRGLQLLNEILGSANSNNHSFYNHLLMAFNLMQFPYYYLPWMHLEKLQIDLGKMTLPNVTDFMLKVMPSCSEIFHSCFFKGYMVNCCEYFKVQKTEQGFCYSFNSRTAENVQRSEPLSHINAFGPSTGLEVFFNKFGDEYLDGDDRIKGNMVYVHQSESFPDVASGFFIPEASRHVLKLAVIPTITQSTNWVPKAMRRSSNKKHATGSHGNINILDNCLLECRLNFIQKSCGCVPYYFPLQDVQICNGMNMKCLSDMNSRLRNIKGPYYTQNFHYMEDDVSIPCDHCLPPSTSILYKVESNYEQTNVVEAKKNYGYLDIHYHYLGGIKYKQDLAFGWIDFLVSVGGISSIFLGFSFISGVELLYWLFYRYNDRTGVHAATVQKVPKETF